MLCCVRVCLWLVAINLLVAASASALLIDDFSDGNDDGWNRLTFILSGLPAIHDASSGRYQMGSTGIVAEDDTGIVARWEASLTDPGFSNGIFSADARVDTEYSSAALILRWTDDGSAYVFSLSNALDKLLIVGFGPTRSQCGAVGCYDVLSEFPFSISENTDYVLRASAVGPNLSFMAWDASGPEPSEAQLTATDTELSEGAFSLTIASYSLNSPTAPISGSFDNVTFTPIPEPSTALLLGIGLTVLGWRRRSR